MRQTLGIVLGLGSFAPAIGAALLTWWTPPVYLAYLAIAAPIVLVAPYMLVCSRLVKDSTKQSDWRAFLLFGNVIAVPLFWFWYVRPYCWPSENEAKAV